MSKRKLTFFAIMVVITVIAVIKWPHRSTLQNEGISPASSEQVIPIMEEEERVQLPVLVEQVTPEMAKAPGADVLTSLSDDSALPPSVDRMSQLFHPYPPTLPIVETIQYTSKVDWLPSRAAYLGDYAAHFKTSKHFIARSLHGIGKYLCQTVSKGDRFNVIRLDHDIRFHLVLDLSRLRMWVYAYDATCDTRFLLKDYVVSAGKRSASSASGCLTPTGVFALGEDIAVYREGMTGYRHQKKIDMLSVFGRRWIPLVKEIADCSGPCKGLGIHGMPCHPIPGQEEWVESAESLGTYASDGCVRMCNDDLAELFAVIVSRPSVIHIVRDVIQAELPGKQSL